MAFRTGFLTNVANVKAVVYFSGIFVTFLMPTTASMKTAMFVMVLLEAAAFFSVMALLSLPGPQRAYRRATAWIDRTAGAVFAAFGVRLLLSSRTH